jgi:hypothetical protein
MKTIYAMIFISLCGISQLHAQEPKEIWELNSSESGNKA